MTGKLEGKVALISGGGGGKGLALCKLLVSEGAKVFVSDVEANRVSGIAAQIERSDRVQHLKLDVSHEADWDSAIRRIKDSDGRLDTLITSARAFGPGPLIDTDLDQWRSFTAVNLDGPFLGAKHALPLMMATGGGSIVGVVSLGALLPAPGLPNYSACNAAVLNLFKSIAVEYGPHGIRANAVIAGFSDNSPVGDAFEVARRVVPIGRPANAMDIARAVLWFASDDSAYATGTSVVLDGGLSVGLRL